MPDHIETRSILDGRLRIEFSRQADRFGHVILLVEGDAARPILSSVEGSGRDLWPLSPVLQQIHVEDRSDSLGRASRRDSATERHVALLVGMAGRSHWSLSVEPVIATAALVFDVACRVSAAESPDLRSTYLPAVVPKLLENGSCVLALENAWLVTVRSEDHCNATLQTGELGLSISPRQLGGPTRRWKYLVELSRS